MPDHETKSRPDAAVDNDVLIKAACYGLTQSLRAARLLGVLGVARYVVAKRIARMTLRGNPSAAQQAAQQLIARSAALEPTVDELRLAATVETLAQRRGLELDAGESQLAAMLLARAIPVLETGDKRALRGLDALVDELPELAPLRGRLRSLEQIVMRCADQGDAAALAQAICAEPGVDKTLSICFRCFSPPPHGSALDHDALMSYVEVLRADAPRVLEP